MEMSAEETIIQNLEKSNQHLAKIERMIKIQVLILATLTNIMLVANEEELPAEMFNTSLESLRNLSQAIIKEPS